MKMPRRAMLKVMIALPSLSVLQLTRTAAAQPLPERAATKLKPTPQDVEGPYYPKSWAGEIDNDLATVNGKAYPNGTPLHIAGTLQTVDGRLLKNARIEIWQTDENANYRHPDSDGEGPMLRGFQGYGATKPDADGRYSFRSIKPKMYGGRPAHVHFKVMAEGYRELITEMYFVGENTEGSLWQRLFGGFSKERDALSVLPKVTRIDGVETLVATFNLVLEPKF